MRDKAVCNWPLTSCVDEEVLERLVIYQWDNYHLTLEGVTQPLAVQYDDYLEMEPIEELSLLMQERRPAPRGVR